MWHFSQEKRNEGKAAPRPRFRPRLETLEDRCVPTAGWVSTSSVSASSFVPFADLARDPAGNTFVTGSFLGTMTIGTTTLVSDGNKDDVFAAKLDPQGDVLWAQRFGGTDNAYGFGVATGDDGSLYVTGKFSGTLTTGAGSLTSAGMQDVFILKLDNEGAVLWARRCGGSNANDSPGGVAVAADGSVYVSGVFNSEAHFGPFTLTTDDGDNFLAKLNGTGDFLWARQLDYGATPWGVLTVPGGDVITVGGALARFDSIGNLLWSQERVENHGALYQDPTTGKDYLYIAEFIGNGVDGNGTVYKLDADTGVEVWNKSVDGNGSASFTVAADANGNVYLSRGSGGSGVDPGVDTSFRLSGAGDFLLKLDADGDFVSARRMTGWQQGWDIEVDAAGNVFLSGVWRGTVEYDLGDTTVVVPPTPAGNQGFFVLKMTQGLGTISGLVYADADNDGTPETDEPPMAGATVYLDQNGNNSLDAGEASATTDAYGVYNLIHVAAGTYTVRQVLPAGWSSSAPAGGAHVVTLAADQFIGGYDFGAHRAPTTTIYTNSKSLKLTDLKTVTSTLVVSGGTSYIYDVDVKLNISHTNDADIRAYLIAPNGTRVLLMYHNGGSGDNYTDTIFDDEAALSITEGTAPFSGRYRPYYSNSFDGLKVFDGKNANGTWTLEVRDDTRKNIGTLLSWSLTIKGASGGSALLAAGRPATADGGAATLTAEQLQPLLAEAVARWSAAGVDTSTLANLTVQIADLGGLTLGMAAGNTIWLDDNAAGWGWFVDPTPFDDSEFTLAGDQGEQGRMDLLSAVMHELGHLLGHDHDDHGAMQEALAAGTRLLPEAGHQNTGRSVALDLIFAERASPAWDSLVVSLLRERERRMA